jgi:hypothetical protein
MLFVLIQSFTVEQCVGRRAVFSDPERPSSDLDESRFVDRVDRADTFSDLSPCRPALRPSPTRLWESCVSIISNFPMPHDGLAAWPPPPPPCAKYATARVPTVRRYTLRRTISPSVDLESNAGSIAGGSDTPHERRALQLKLSLGPPRTIDGAALPLLPFQAEIDTGAAKFTTDHATAASDEPRASFVGGRTAP